MFDFNWNIPSQLYAAGLITAGTILLLNSLGILQSILSFLPVVIALMLIAHGLFLLRDLFTKK